MALRQVMISDLTGAEGDEDDFVTLTIRRHAKLDEPKALDVLPDEVAGLKSQPDLVFLEINGEQVVVTLAEFRKVCPDEKLGAGRSTRGRRPGTRLG